jgi:hypothetical protein
VVAVAVLASGCGGDGGKTATHFAEPTTTAEHCKGQSRPEQAAQRRHLERDLVTLRAAAATMKRYAQDGNTATNEALDQFMLDVAAEALPVFERSRYINRAAAIVSPKCYLCFQALEANRPVAAGGKLACG